MKTLKLLTIICLIALVGGIIFGAVKYSETTGVYAIDSIDIQAQEDRTETEEISTSSKDGYKIGDVATDFKLQNIDDNYVSLSDYKQTKGYIVIFTCNHCPYSKAYENRIIAIDKEYKKKGYPVIAINPNNPDLYPEDSFENMKVRAADKGFTFPYLFDAKQDIYPQYGATKTPHVFLLEKEIMVTLSNT